MLRGLKTLAMAALVWAALSPAHAQKAFVRDDLQTSGAQLEERLKREIAAPSAAAPSLIQQANAQLSRGEPRRALALANQAVIASPQSAEAWRIMARAAQAIDPRDYRERYDLQERALAAAYLSYSRARGASEEASSLRLLAELFEARSLWRPALTAYRLSLEAQDAPETRKAFETLREARGFRLTENKTDADSATPRACFVFSEPLAKGRTDFAPFVAVTGNRSETVVTAEDNQICVEGLRHGERYGIVIRQGVPSAIPGEVLLKTADYDIYVRDRTPSVRFTGRNYVLPRTGQQGLPLVSVNTDKVQLEIARIGERNLINTVQGEEFLTQISKFGLKEIGDAKGQKVWSGTMDVKSELNRDVTTAFPAQEALGRLQPGVYVLVATPLVGASQPQAAPADDADDSADASRSAAQWFIVSDLGLTSFTGADGVHVLVRSLADAKPLRNTDIQLLARSNEVLGQATTDAQGYARFDGALARGKGGLSPGMITARAGEDFAFLDLKQSAFDLSDRGVKGRVAPTGLDAFVFAERGVYRSGETVYLTAILRDANGAAVSGLPLTLVAKRPDGVEYRRQVVADQGAGGRAWSLPLVGGASTGTWRVQSFADPRGDAIGETTFLVEDYVPERLDAEVKPKRTALRSGEPAEIDVEARFLYGAPGADLEVGGTILVRPAARSAIPGLEGYRIGLTDETVEPVKNDIEEKQKTDARGRAALALTLNEPETTQPLEAEITLAISESGGRAINRAVTLPILPKGNVIGVKPLFEDGALGEGASATFHAVMATGEGRRLDRKATWTLSRITRRYQWFFQEGRWNYEAVKSTRRVADGEVSLTAAAPAQIEARVGWGSYRLEVRSEGSDSAETAIIFDVGFVAEAKADTPDVLEVALDKAAYAVGETMQVRLAPRFAGQATLVVVGNGVRHLQTVDMPQTGITVPLRVDASWGAGAYVVALAHRPLDVQAQRMPGRAIGLAWAGFDRAQRMLQVETGAPQLIRPRGTLELPVKLTGLRSGEEAFVTVAAVDVGILNLTRYQTPNLVEHVLGQRQLGLDVRDLYGFLIDGMQGMRGAYRSGGDATAPMTGEKPTQEPFARYSGVVKVGPDGIARVRFDVPAFNGTARVMVAAWSAGRVGQATSDVIIRDPVVAQATLPRFLAVGDRSRVHVEINNVEADAGEFTLSVALSGPVAMEADAARRTMRLARGQKAEAILPVLAAGIGTATLNLMLEGGGQTLTQQLALRVQPSGQAISNRSVRALPAGGSLTLSADLLADMIPGSGSVAVSVSPFAALDVPALLKALDRYPYGCTEQTVSRAFPLLFVNRLASMEQLALDDSAEARVGAAIDTVLSRQGANGSFGLWGVGGDDLWLDAFVTDFLTRAREAGRPVPAVAFSLALDRLRNQVVNAGEVRGEEASGIAYALYVLARNGRPVMGDLRYLVDNRLSAFPTPLAKGQLGAALAALGDRGRARAAFDDAVTTLGEAKQEGVSRMDYGSKLRDGSGLLTLMAEAQSPRADLLRVAAEVETARADVRFSSTQEQTWMVLAAQALAREAEQFRLTVDGQPHSGALYRTVGATRLETAPLVIGNPGSNPARAIVTVSGAPLDPLPALDQGFKVERELLDLKGERVAMADIRQNMRYVVRLTVTEPRAQFGRVLLVDPLPAGFEIENARIGGDGSTEGFAFLKSDLAPTMTERRDDRFVAAFDRSSSQKPQFVVGYIVRAVTPGRYVHPAASVEDMYRPDRFGRGASGLIEVQPKR